MEAPEPVADVPETLDHAHRHGESQWAKATSAVVGLVQEGRAELTMMAPPMEPIYADDARALAGQVADGQEVRVFALSHVLVARAHRQTGRHARTHTHTGGDVAQPHSGGGLSRQHPVLHDGGIGPTHWTLDGIADILAMYAPCIY